MFDAADKAARREAVLAKLSDLGVSLAERLHERAMAAADQPEIDQAQIDRLTLAFHRVSRSVRQTMALDARFDRERELAGREAVQARARETISRVQKKRSQLRKAVIADVWSEYEPEDPDALLENIDAWVYDIAEDDGFLDEPFEALVSRIRQALGLPANDGEVEDEAAEAVVAESSG